MFGELETLLPTQTKYARQKSIVNYVAVSTQSMMAEMNASKQSIDKGQSNMITLNKMLSVTVRPHPCTR